MTLISNYGTAALPPFEGVLGETLAESSKAGTRYARRIMWSIRSFHTPHQVTRAKAKNERSYPSKVVQARWIGTLLDWTMET